MLPNLVILGFPKCGTSSLFTWLADHPQVAGSSIKETHFFVDRETFSFRPGANFHDHGLARYEDFFPAETDANIIVEATPQYVFEETAFEQLTALRSHPNFIIIVRNPADQIMSTYNYFRSNFSFLDPSITFADFQRMARTQSDSLPNNYLLRNAITNCNYESHIQKWVDRVGAERVRVYLFEEMKAETKSFMRAVAEHLGIASSFYETYSFPVENYSYTLRNYRLHQWNIRVRRLLPIPNRSHAWRALRSVYRAINTRTRKAPLPAPDQAAYLALKEEFAPAYEKLRGRYGLAARRETGATLMPATT